MAVTDPSCCGCQACRPAEPGGGLSVAEATRTLAALIVSPGFAGMSITEINPDHFPDNATLPSFVGAVADALAAES